MVGTWSKAVEKAKGLIKATGDLGHNVSASKIYTKELHREVAKVRELKFKRGLESENLVVDPILTRIKLEDLNQAIDAGKREISRFRTLRRPHVKEIKKGLILPTIPAAALSVGGVTFGIHNKNRSLKDG